MHTKIQNSGSVTTFQRWITSAVAVVFFLSQQVTGVQIAIAASTWSPTMLVNTEAFQVIDESDASANVELRFGDVVNEVLRWDRTSSQFQITDDLEILGTGSGQNLYATKSISGTYLYAAATFGGAGLTNCTGSSNKLTWLSSTKQFACETDQTGGASTIVDHYVRASGDTMTGGLVIETRASGGGTPASLQAGVLLEVAGTMSGRTLHGQDSVNSSGSVLGYGDFTLNSDNGAVDAVLNFGSDGVAEALTFANTADVFRFSDDLEVIGNLEVTGTSSGVNLYATKSMTGAHINATTTFAGAGLSNCTGASSKLTWLSSAKQFACEADETGGGASGIVDHYVRAGGDTMTGGLLIENRASGGGTPGTVQANVLLEVAGATSGRVIHAQDRLASSGVLILRPSAAMGGNGKATLMGSGTRVGIMTNGRGPHSTLTTSGSFATAQTIMTATGTISGVQNVIYASGAISITLTLPTAVGINGREYKIIKSDTKSVTNNTVRIVTTGGQTISGVSGWSLVHHGDWVSVISDGANWRAESYSGFGQNGMLSKGSSLNQYYSSPNTGTALSTATLTNGALRVMPFLAERVLTIDQIAINVTTTAASTEVRVGIYRDNGGLPEKLLIDAGTVATTTTGVKTWCASGCTTTTSSLPMTLQPGLYWLAINANGGPVIRGFAVASLRPVLGYASTLPTAASLGYTVASTYGALPTTYPSGPTVVTAAPLPAIFVRLLY